MARRRIRLAGRPLYGCGERTERGDSEAALDGVTTAFIALKGSSGTAPHSLEQRETLQSKRSAKAGMALVRVLT
jgi:hypothetical protein